MKKLILLALVAVMSLAGRGQQFFGIDVNKLSLLIAQTVQLPHDNAKIVLQSTMTALEKNPSGYRKALEFAENHLGNPADSLHNETLYYSVLEHAVKGFVLSNSEKQRPKLLLELAQRNKIGSAATDIAYVTPDGKAGSLAGLKGKFVLLYFNDPDCDACAKTKEALERSSVRQAVEKGDLAALAINPEDNEKKWKKTDYPAWMVNGWDKAQVINGEQTYVMPAQLPVFYLISPDGVVLMKNEASLKRMESAIEKALGSADKSADALVKLLFNP